MPGFNYGGRGDGTGWSSERGDGPEPGGGHQGHGGDRNNAENSSGSKPGRISPSVAKPVESYMTPWGKVIINSAGHPLMNGIIMTADNSSLVTYPSDKTHYTRILNSLINKPVTLPGNASNKSPTQTAVENYLAGGAWAGAGPIDTSLINTAISDSRRNQPVNKPVLSTGSPDYKKMRNAFDSLPVDRQPQARDQIIQAWQKAHDILPDKIKTYDETGGQNGYTITNTSPNSTKKILGGLIPQVKADINNALTNNQKTAAQADEKEALTKSSELIADMGEKIGAQLGEKYKAVAKEIANDIKNFQGKTLRTHKQTMTSLNKILANPGMKVNKGDRDALINAWKSFKAGDTAKKLGNLSRAFKVADIALKAEKVREKSIHGYDTGDWGPLMLEVESWVLSGIAAGVAIGLFGAILSMLTVSGLVLTAITIVGIMAISYLSSKIDDKIAEKINNEVVRPAN